jgi:hypothetical protein
MRRTTTALSLIAAVSLALTACGSGKPETAGGDGKGTAEQAPFADLSGPEIVAKALKATKNASSLTLKGDVPDGKDTVKLNMALDRAGNCAGSIGMSGGNADIIKTGDTVYSKFDEALLRSESEGEPKSETDAVVDMLAGRWMKTDADSDDAKEMTAFCDLDELLAEFDGTGSAARKGKATTLDGTPAFTLTEADGKDRYTLYVATEGKPYLLRIENTTAKQPDDLSFTDYDKPVPATPPADKDIVDLDKL